MQNHPLTIYTTTQRCDQRLGIKLHHNMVTKTQSNKMHTIPLEMQITMRALGPDV